MTKTHWELFKAILKGEAEGLNVGLIVDSPWMPGYVGISTIDFYVRPNEWLSAYVKIKKDFPDVLFLPDWWAEYGMATEPSGFGVKFNFYDDNLPTIHPISDDMDDIEDILPTLKVPNPRKDGLMPLLLNLQRYMKPRLEELGEQINIVSTRGPLTIASHLFTVTELLLCIKADPDTAHKLLKITTQLCKDWLSAQLESVGTAEGVLLLDDVTGFFGTDDYLEFAHPYLKEVFAAFPECIRLFHNDTSNNSSFPYMGDLGIDLFNHTHEKDIANVRTQVASNVTLLGNIPPMSLANETPDEVCKLAKNCVENYISAAGSTKGLLLSIGGGVPMGAKGDCIEALIKVSKEYTKC
jgi:uroporphyrinogen decarboxylase